MSANFISPVNPPEYAELHCISNFTFLRGASHPEELVQQAARLKYTALALTDECSVAGVVRAHVEAKEHNLKLIIGSEFACEDKFHLVLLAKNRTGYSELCGLITAARRAAAKGEYRINSRMLAAGSDHCVVLWVPGKKPLPAQAQSLKERFAERLWLAVELSVNGNDQARLQQLQDFAGAVNLPLVASGGVHMHVRARRVLQDTVTAIRQGTTVDHAGFSLYANGERHLRKPLALAHLYPEELLNNTAHIAAQCNFSLDELRYEYPDEVVPSGRSAQEYLRHLSLAGARKRWPQGVSTKVRNMIEHELQLIAELHYEKYFLTVYDIVRFAKEQGILCQGRGSAANSAVCFCLGITEVDPARMAMLFERFISKERNEPPDIDVDFEHERREEVIQYIYQKYGRERAALTATVICYRPRSAMRDVGKALGLDDLQTDRLARAMQWWDGRTIREERVREAGFDPQNPMIRQLLALVREILGFPRHLSQHVGGFVISRGPLHELVPIENAAMAERTVIQWDKDDLDDLGLLKVDVLGLGMLTAVHRSFDLIKKFRNKQWTLATIPAEDPAVYEMISRADTVGVFQIESRAQMAMLPRLRPQCFYDLVIEVAIVRPGPIQGDMVHPYLRRRNGEEPVSYPSKEIQSVLERTLGVPIFQEQVMHLAMVAAGFSAGEADRLRRAMAAWKRKGGLGPFEERLIDGMQARGYARDFAEKVFRQIQGFGEYGFPESHSASFALIVYVSAWLKRYEPAAFFCAMLNSLPMGFYAPAQLVRAARQHDVAILPVAVNHSFWDCSLEADANGAACLRLGFSRVKGFKEAAAHRLAEARHQGLFCSAADAACRAALDRRDMELLASGGALEEFAGHRHKARWQVAGIEPGTPLMPQIHIPEGEALLNRPTAGETLVADYEYLGLSLDQHPLALLRDGYAREQLYTAEALWGLPAGTRVQIAGLVVTRQRPGTASGVTFVTLEDETGHVNLVVWKKIAERDRRALLGSRLLRVCGETQQQGGVLHLIAHSLHDDSARLGRLTAPSRDFH
ncbi:MAG: error-prone DNA polymerase [Gammaproteobacteria bacterium]|nr:error-prone DNA polymerase [Gammaproteobacteria bacterium]